MSTAIEPSSSSPRRSSRYWPTLPRTWGRFVRGPTLSSMCGTPTGSVRPRRLTPTWLRFAESSAIRAGSRRCAGGLPARSSVDMRARLLLVFAGVMALVLLVHDVPLARHLQRVERDRLVTQLERDAFVIAGRAEEGLENGTIADQPALQALVARYAVEEQVHVVIVDADGVGVSSSDATDLGEGFANRPEFQSALTGVPASGERFSETLGDSCSTWPFPCCRARTCTERSASAHSNRSSTNAHPSGSRGCCSSP